MNLSGISLRWDRDEVFQPKDKSFAGMDVRIVMTTNIREFVVFICDTDRERERLLMSYKAIPMCGWKHGV